MTGSFGVFELQKTKFQVSKKELGTFWTEDYCTHIHTTMSEPGSSASS